MRIAVVGAGAIGCLWGVRLHRSGEQVLLVHHRREVIEAVQRRGVRLRESNGRVLKARIQIDDSLSRSDPVDLVLVTVKAYDTRKVASMLRKTVGQKTAVLSLQNGLGNVEALSREVWRGSVLAGSTSESAMSLGPGDVIHTGRGRTWIGELDGLVSKRCLAINEVFRKSGFASEVSGNVRGLLWAKAIVNSAVNPISAMTGLPNGELRGFALRKLGEKVVKEGERVALAAGVSPSPRPIRLMSDVLLLTRRNKSSMLEDIENKRMTEIRELNGAISRVGKRHRVGTPYNDLFTALIIGREISAKQQDRSFRS